MPPEVMTRPEVVSIIVAVVLSLGGALVAFATAAKRWADSKFSPIAKDVKDTKEQAVNTHGPDGKNDNLRDQLDRMEKSMTKGFNRMDHQFGEVHDRQQATDDRALDEHHRLWDAIKSSEK